MKEIVENALGTMVVQIDGNTDNPLYGYFGKYGSPPDSIDDLSLVTQEFPSYPTDNVVEVKVERRGSAYVVTEARWIDTSGGATRGEWHTLEELNEDEL